MSTSPDAVDAPMFVVSSCPPPDDLWMAQQTSTSSTTTVVTTHQPRVLFSRLTGQVVEPLPFADTLGSPDDVLRSLAHADAPFRANPTSNTNQMPLLRTV
ncbi:hypothetical protein H257_08488 [Aphanomyces astaci]|uniref:Uncharacterized protein n=1 Tax=Aphanomyces astaci TaxID=112090 RepID=W4GD31_APHAT|nr:hypothetical protein H257_08488 [Aphanomyces astaci]ETV77560.1 hypothetical protein H257_08488 [Aphanomyces astaci]|eukprot:XP_009832670.1 hypothetical protein H257_08488 [Aphanomyces astaci]